MEWTPDEVTPPIEPAVDPRPGRRVPRLLVAASDLVWPALCAGCGRAGVRWCPVCAALLTGPARSTAPIPCPPGLPPVWASASYDGPVRRAIVTWKDEERHDLTRPLAAALALAIRAALLVRPVELVGATEAAPGDGAVLLVPVPSRRAARRTRGADPVRELALRAAEIARSAGLSVQVRPALGHRRGVLDQAGLGAQARARNMSGALRVRAGALARVRGQACLVVDDIVTTGATLVAAAGALREAGAHPFGAAVVAATARSHGGG
jgi:predicted amidophosphoribosyltransferase